MGPDEIALGVIVLSLMAESMSNPLPMTGRAYIDDPQALAGLTESLRDMAWRYGKKHNIEPRFILAILCMEASAFGEPSIGDRMFAGGPSIGPMQVYRKTAKELGLVDSSISRSDYESLAYQTDLCMDFGCKVILSKLKYSNIRAPNDYRRLAGNYNGSGENGDYAREVVNRLKSWGVKIYGET